MLDDIQEPTSEEKPISRKTILIVEDNYGIGAFLVEAVRQETPYRPLLAKTSEGALEIVQHVKPDLFILDYYLGNIDGLALYDQLHEQKALEAIPAIILSASLKKFQHEIDQRHLVGLAKPVELDEFLLVINQLLSIPQELE